MFVLYGWNAKVSHLSSQIYSYFCFMNHRTKQYEAIFTGRRIKESMVLWWGAGDVMMITHAASCEFNSQRSLGPCCPSSASGWWLVSWYTLPVSAYCIPITRSKQASWSSFQAVRWQPILCKSSHAECLLGLFSVLLREILLKRNIIKKKNISWVCEDAKVLTWYSGVIKT